MAESRAPAVSQDDLTSRAIRVCDDVLYIPRFILHHQAIYGALAAQLDWREESIMMFGRRVKVPRLCTWCGDEGVVYRYSHTVHRATGWAPFVESIRDDLQACLNTRFNFVLGNLYRDGKDAMGWHADDEPELGNEPCIASLSFGASRRFDLRAREGSGHRASVILEPGSLLLMQGRSQRNWQHALPRTKATIGPRINLTFRRVEPS